MITQEQRQEWRRALEYDRGTQSWCFAHHATEKLLDALGAVEQENAELRRQLSPKPGDDGYADKRAHIEYLDYLADKAASLTPPTPSPTR